MGTLFQDVAVKFFLNVIFQRCECHNQKPIHLLIFNIFTKPDTKFNGRKKHFFRHNLGDKTQVTVFDACNVEVYKVL